MSKELKEQIKSNFNNEFNCVPVGFGRLAKIIPGWMKGVHIGLTGSKQSGKTKYATYHFVINALDFVKKINDPARLDIKILIYLTKTSSSAYRAALYSAFLFRDHGLDLPYLQLMSIMESKDRAMNEKVLTLLDSYDKWFEWFDSKVELYDNKKKTSEIFSTAKTYFNNEVGTDWHDDRGEKAFKYNNPNLFVCIMTDAVNGLSPETDKGQVMDIKKCIDKHVGEHMVTLKNQYGACILSIHDQAIDKEKIEYDFSGRTKEEKLEPSGDGLGESKTAGKSYDILIGLHNPAKYEFASHKNYSVARLKENYRSLKIIDNTFGKATGYMGYWFNGGAGTFEELPPSKDLEQQLALDKYIKQRRKE